MTSESTGSETFNADNHDQETKKEYYQFLDDEAVAKMAQYFRIEQQSQDHDVFLKYLKQNKVPSTTPDHV
jgi:hypothetical protein